LFYKIFHGRGHGTYGKEAVSKALDVYESTFSIGIDQQIAAEKIIARAKSFFIDELRENVSLIRLGAKFDGGYYVPADSSFDYVISAGIGKNCEFEQEFASQGVTVIAIDPTVPSLPHPHSSITHIQKFLSGSLNNRKCVSLKAIVEGYNNELKKTILKLDIEGAEYEILESIEKNRLFSGLLIVEFHNLYQVTNDSFRQQFERTLSFLEDRYQPIHFHSNNWGTFHNVGNYFFPEVFEVTLINREISHQLIPGTSPLLSVPNNPKRLEIPNKIFEA